MPKLFEAPDADESVRVVVLTFAGEHFSFGLDLGTGHRLRVPDVVPGHRAS
jgi:hypothetical protein